MGAGISSGPTPWWQTGGQQANLNNLQSSAPDGYKYDPVQMSYVRTPTSLGADAGAAGSAAITGLSGALSGLTGTPAASAATAAPGAAVGAADTGLPPHVGSSAGGTSSGSASGGSSSGSPTVPQIQAPDTTAANAAIFAKAKDQVGLQARSALQGLEGEMAGRGTVGSGVEGRGMTSLIASGQGQLGDVTRQNAVTDAGNAEANATTGFNGAVTQRGQDLSSALGGLNADVTQRGQDLNAEAAAANNLTTQRGQTLNATNTASQLALQRLSTILSTIPQVY